MAISGDFAGGYSVLGLAALVATALFAWREGGRAERLGGVLLVLGWMVGGIARQMIGHPNVAGPFLSDAVDATGFVLVAVRYSCLWLAPTLLIYSGGFTLRAIELGMFGSPQWPAMLNYATITDGLSYLVLFVVAWATYVTMMERQRATRLKDSGPLRAAAA